MHTKFDRRQTKLLSISNDFDEIWNNNNVRSLDFSMLSEVKFNFNAEMEYVNG